MENQIKEEQNDAYEKIKVATKDFTYHGCSAAIIGPSGVGKSVLANAFAEELVADILGYREGDGLASLNRVYLHPTDMMIEGQVLIVSTFKKDIVNTDKNKKLFAKVLLKCGEDLLKQMNSKMLNEADMLELFKKFLKRYLTVECVKKDNTSFSHMLSFLETKEKEETLNMFVDIFSNVPLHELTEIIRTIKKSSKKNHDTELIDTIRTCLDEDWRITIEGFLKVCESVALKLRQRAFPEETDLNKDHYTTWLNEDSTDAQKKMFLNSESDSVEFLFEQIDIYYKISEEMEAAIDANYSYKNMLKTRFGEIYFTLSDHQGLFHQSDDVDQAVKEAKNSIYQSSSDLVIFCLGAKVDAINKKALMVLQELKSTIRKDINVLVVMPKVDELVSQSEKKVNKSSRFKRNDEEVGLTDEEKFEKVGERVGYVRQALDSVEVDNKRSINILDVVAYGMYSSTCPESISDKYNPIDAFSSILKHLSKVSYDGVDKIKIKLNEDYNDIDFVWNDDLIDEKIKSALNESDLFHKSVYIPVVSNIYHNMRLQGHGNSAKSALNNAKYGMGHDGNIDMDWFVNVESINIQFPATLVSIITKILSTDFLDSMVLKQGAYLTEKDKEEFYKKLYSAFSSGGSYHLKHAGRALSGKLFYENHVMAVKANGYFSYGSLLKKSLKSAFESYTLWSIGNVTEIVDAYKEVVTEMCDAIKDKYITFI